MFCLETTTDTVIMTGGRRGREGERSGKEKASNVKEGGKREKWENKCVHWEGRERTRRSVILYWLSHQYRLMSHSPVSPHRRHSV